MDPQQGKADIAPDPNTRISMEEYLDLAMNLNDMSMKSFLMDKINLFSRPGLREYMRRPALEIASASDEEIRQFLQTFGKVTGKCNSSAGKGFRIYTDSACTDNTCSGSIHSGSTCSDNTCSGSIHSGSIHSGSISSDSEADMAARIRSDGVDILEPFLRQHPAYQAIYPDSLNTLRVHTVRTSREVRIFLPVMLSAGSDGAVTDVSGSTTRYRVLLSRDGSILLAARQDPGKACQITDRHHNTGYLFRQGRKLPGIRACLECCRKAAFYIPEMRYIGWDVAVTEDGPVIVEANNLSGLFYAYQQAQECISGDGVRSEVERMLSFGMEGVPYNQDLLFVSEPLAGVRTSLPGLRHLYLILLQSALHRHGVEYYDRAFIKTGPAARKSCTIRYLAEENAVLLQTGQRTVRIPQPDLEMSGLSPYGEDKEHPGLSEEDFFALDQIATREAARIYRALLAEVSADSEV